MKGKLPVTEVIFLETKKEEWQIMSGDSINYRVTALIEKSPGVKVRVNLVIKQIYPPRNLLSKVIINANTAFDQMVPNGAARLMGFLHDNLIIKNLWVLTGLIEGENKVPIIIYYHEKLDVYIYTQKLENEKEKDWAQIASQN